MSYTVEVSSENATGEVTFEDSTVEVTFENTTVEVAFEDPTVEVTFENYTVEVATEANFVTLTDVYSARDRAEAAAVSAKASETFVSSASSNATQQALVATDKALEAAESATQAKASELISSNNAQVAIDNAATSGTKASEASTSASEALDSANTATTKARAASTSASSASAAANTATTKASEASTSASSASAAANTATTKAREASTSASSASAAANTATTKAREASTSASSASAAANTATTKAREAEISAAEALASETATRQLFDQFGDQYLGPHAEDPTTDNEGGPLAEGNIYWNTADNILKFYSGSAWVAPEDIATTAAATATTKASEARASASAALASKNTATTKASEASASASKATTKASEASASASEATTKASEASASASSALASKNTATTKASEATTKASEASASASEASSSASSALSSANTATTAANTATTKASEASASASSALASKKSASTSASTATTKASEASTSASSALASKNLAQEWADNAVGLQVTGNPGKYSAKHHATKAAASASSASTSANTATTKANEASASATAASLSENNAAQAATSATESAIQQHVKNTDPHSQYMQKEGAGTAAAIKAALLTVDGAGSGLDADLLDGKHGSFYSDANQRRLETYSAYYPGSSGENIDNAAPGDCGLYSTRNPGTFPLAGGGFYFITTQKVYTSDDTLFQIAHSYKTSNPSISVRNTISENPRVWSPWGVQWNSVNDGAGSGLDADLLDGQNGSYYRAWGNITGVPATFPPSSHKHDNYVDTNGGVFKGDIYFDGTLNVRTTGVKYPGSSTAFDTGNNSIAFTWSTPTLWGHVDNNSKFAVGTTSDYRIKENVTNLTDCLDKVNMLRPVMFDALDFDGTPGEKNHVGFIAHELQEVIPSAVSGKKDEVNHEGKPIYQGVNYAILTSVLAGAIQELTKKVETLEKQITSMKE